MPRTTATNVTYDHTGFQLKLSAVRRNVFLPKYYSPEIASRLSELEKTHDLVSIGELIAKKYLRAVTGDEIGKMAYGTGTIPFVRTSDVSNWELKTDAKQGVSDRIYAEYQSTQNVRAGDIFFVKDGTYLIGQIGLVTESDLPLLYQSHIIKLRVSDDSPLTAHMLMACLSAPIVKAQIRSKQFTADIIDTVGDRFREILLPVPRDRNVVARIAEEVKHLTAERSRLRDKIKRFHIGFKETLVRLMIQFRLRLLLKQSNMATPAFAGPFRRYSTECLSLSITTRNWKQR